MGFWRWLTGQPKISRIEKELIKQRQRIEEEQRITDHYVRIVRDIIADPTNPLGFSVVVDKAYESVVLSALQTYVRQPYAVYKTTDEDMEYIGQCKIHVGYIQFPVAPVVAKKSSAHRFF
jgi:hypothetical protein